jgi:hypothetical protein
MIREMTLCAMVMYSSTALVTITVRCRSADLAGARRQLVLECTPPLCGNGGMKPGAEMRAYVAACGLIFAFVVIAHSLELRGGGIWHLREADFALSTLAVLGMLTWSIALLIRTLPRKP